MTMLIAPTFSDPSPTGRDRAYREWKFAMQRAHNGRVDTSRAIFEAHAVLVPRTAADVEAERLHHAGIAARVRSDIPGHRAGLRRCIVRFGRRHATTRSWLLTLADAYRALRYRDAELAALRAEIDRAEAVRAMRQAAE